MCLALNGAPHAPHLHESPHMHQDAGPLGALRGIPTVPVPRRPQRDLSLFVIEFTRLP